MKSISIAVILFIFLSHITVAQLNTTPLKAYKQKISSGYIYSTKTDEGYVMLLDSTVLKGKLTLKGRGADKLDEIVMKTTSGAKHNVRPESVHAYGLGNGSNIPVPSSDISENYLALRLSDKEGDFVITNQGEKITGELILTRNSDLYLWAPDKVTLKTADGSTKKFICNGELISAVINSGDERREYITFENQLVQVESRIENWVLLRNPHPRKTSFSKKLNYVSSSHGGSNKMMNAYSEAVKYRDEAYIKMGAYKLTSAEKAKLTSHNNAIIEFYKNRYLGAGFVKENLILNLNSYRHAIFSESMTDPMSSIQIKGLLNGSIKYQKMSSSEQKALFKMKEPNKTLRFLADNMID